MRYVIMYTLLLPFESLNQISKNYDKITSKNKINFILISYSCATNIENLSTNGLLK